MLVKAGTLTVGFLVRKTCQRFGIYFWVIPVLGVYGSPRIAFRRDTLQNCSLMVNCAERGPPKAYKGLCPPRAAPPPRRRFVVDPGPILPKVVSKILPGSGDPGAPNMGWLKTLKYSARTLRLKRSVSLKRRRTARSLWSMEYGLRRLFLGKSPTCPAGGDVKAAGFNAMPAGWVESEIQKGWPGTT